MASASWTDEENDLIVADYFAMLAYDTAGRRYSKIEHGRALLNDRPERSVEFKGRKQNVAKASVGGEQTSGHRHR